jgi:hypothetical protein
MPWNMGMFLLCGAMGLQTMQKKAEAREKANETLISTKINRATIAMYHGKSEEALQLIGEIEDEDINRRDRGWGITLLGTAILFNCMDVVQVLIGRGADLNMKCCDPDAEYCELRDQLYGNSAALGMAIIDKNKEMIKLFVKQGADVNALIWRTTPLQKMLSDYSHFFRLGNDYFRRDKLDRDYLQLDKAKYRGIYDDCLRQLPPGQNCLLLDEEGLETINDCCSKNILKGMRLLIENGANVNARDDEGDTILHYLVGNFSYGGPFSFEFVDLLFKAGADPRIANKNGEFPLENFGLPYYVVKKFPKRVEDYVKLMDMFWQRIDELNAQNT